MLKLPDRHTKAYDFNSKDRGTNVTFNREFFLGFSVLIFRDERQEVQGINPRAG